MSNFDSVKLNFSPLVCICIPTFNAAETIAETLQSILAQTYSNFVVHISDNASTDNTLKIIESILDDRVTIHKYTENVGAEGNFTRCIELATGKYTAIFHADDIYEPDMVIKQIAYLEDNLDVGAAFTEALTIDEQGAPFGTIGCVPRSSSKVTRLNFPELLKTMLLHQNFLVCPSVMVRTVIYKEVIKVWGSSLFKSASDVDTWLRLAHYQTIAVLNDKLMRYRISSAQFSNSNRNRIERADFFLVMDHYLAKDDVRSFLTIEDFRHYARLERHERVARAYNLFGFGRVTEAKPLLSGFLCWDAIYAAIFSRRGLMTFSGWILLNILIKVGALNAGILIVNHLKRMLTK
jgi:glycosyltransferase involved in cell wall biosynthesis